MILEDNISIENISFSYEKHQVFKQINLTTNAGEVFCLMGKNGCGKSTLIDCILGIHKIDEGNITISGKKNSSYKAGELARKISYVPQVHDKSFPYLVKEIVLMGRTTYINGFGTPEKIDREIVESVMEEIGIGHLSNRPYTQVSGGEMQMIALARALVQETPIIIMDEPTAHLDYYNELYFLEKVSKILETSNKTIVMATHSPNQAFYLENIGVNVRVGLMKDGALKVVGTPSQVLTPESIADIYGIEANIMSDNMRKQIIPIRTII